MPPKAVDARRRFNQNHRLRGHRPLLHGHHHLRGRRCIHGGIYKGRPPLLVRPAASRRGPPAPEAALSSLDAMRQTDRRSKS
jgi:hypothetical protein